MSTSNDKSIGRSMSTLKQRFTLVVGLASSWRREPLLGVFLLAAGAASMASPVPAEVIVWPTYLRTSPDRSAVVIGELSRNKPVSVQACTRGWCRIEVDGVVGYVERGRVGPTGPPTAFAPSSDPTGCFSSQRSGYKGGQPYRYCPLGVATSPSEPPASAPGR